MKTILIAVILLASLTAFAGRPTPLGDSMAQIKAVSEEQKISEKILNIRLENEDPLHYVIELRNYGTTSCYARGYILTLIERDPVTAYPTYEVTADQSKRVCIVHKE